MKTDVSQPRGAQHGVHQRVNRHIRVAVAEKPLLPGDFHPAENQLPVLRKTMHVIAVANPRQTGRKTQNGFRHLYILSCCQLDIVPLAPYHGDRITAVLQKGGVVRSPESVLTRAGKSFPKPVRPAGLRRLDFIKQGTIRRLQHLFFPADLDRVGGRKPGNRGAFFHGRVPDPADQTGGNQAAGAVMDQNQILRPAVTLSQTVFDGILAGGSAGNQTKDTGKRDFFRFRPCRFFLSGTMHNDDLIRDGGKGFHAPLQYAFAPQGQEYLILLQPHAGAGTRGQHQHNSLHGAFLSEERTASSDRTS